MGGVGAGIQAGTAIAGAYGQKKRAKEARRTSERQRAESLRIASPEHFEELVDRYAKLFGEQYRPALRNVAEQLGSRVEKLGGPLAEYRAFGHQIAGRQDEKWLLGGNGLGNLSVFVRRSPTVTIQSEGEGLFGRSWQGAKSTCYLLILAGEEIGIVRKGV